MTVTEDDDLREALDAQYSAQQRGEAGQNSAPSTCPCCKRTIEQYSDYSICSEFCAQTTDAEKAAWKNLKVGEYGCYPCPDCGCVMEDMYELDGHCSDCEKKRRLNAKIRLLKEVLTVTGLPGDLLAKIRAELGGK